MWMFKGFLILCVDLFNVVVAKLLNPAAVNVDGACRELQLSRNCCFLVAVVWLSLHRLPSVRSCQFPHVLLLPCVDWGYLRYGKGCYSLGAQLATVWLTVSTPRWLCWIFQTGNCRFSWRELSQHGGLDTTSVMWGWEDWEVKWRKCHWADRSKACTDTGGQPVWPVSREQSEVLYYHLRSLTFTELFCLYSIKSYSRNIGMQLLWWRCEDTDLTWLPSCSHWTCLTENVGFYSLALPDFLTRRSADLLPRLFLSFYYFNFFCVLIWDTWRGFLWVYLSLERSYSLLHSVPPSVNSPLVPRSPSVFTSEWQEIKIFSDAGGNTACDEPDYSRDTQISGGASSKIQRERGRNWYTVSLLMLVFDQKN